MTVRKNPKLAPVRIEQDALGPGCPNAPLWVSRQHRMLVASPIAERMLGAREALVAAIHLTHLRACSVDQAHQVKSYHHLVFDTHVIVTANGAPSESFFPGDIALGALPPDACTEFKTLFPNHALQRRPVAARLIPHRAQQKRLIARHAKNRKPLITA